jgi:hypothetical protein
MLALTSAAAVGTLLPRWLEAAPAGPPGVPDPATPSDPALLKDWQVKWEKSILDGQAHDRYCDKETGEELGWLVSPYLYGFYYGYRATGDLKWIDLLMDWTESWTRRGVKEPDGFIGWPKADGTSTDVVPHLFTDNILGEAMALRPAVLIAGVIQTTPSLKEKYGAAAQRFVDLSERVFAKWDARFCWRETHEGGVWVVPTFGIDQKTNKFDANYDNRKTDGFSLPDNKQNFVALWLIAMADVTGKAIYRKRATQWWQVMKSRMRVRDDKYYVWDYWDPAGPWDYKPDGQTRHWTGVHPNGGYYDIDLEGIVAAYQHGLVFEKPEIDRLIATNRDYMWNGKINGAKFQSIDGQAPRDPWKNTPGVLWNALIPYDAKLRQVFEANHKPASWGGLAATPWYLAWATKKLGPSR